MRAPAAVCLAIVVGLLAVPGPLQSAQAAEKNCHPKVSLDWSDDGVAVKVTPGPVIPTGAEGPGDDVTPTPSSSPTPEPTVSPEPSTAPEPSTSPEPTATPVASPAPSTAGVRQPGLVRTTLHKPKPITCTDATVRVVVENTTTGAKDSYTVPAGHPDTREFIHPVYAGQWVEARVTQGDGEDTAEKYRHFSPPSPPTNVVAGTITKTSAALSWDKPEFGGHNLVKWYRVSVDGSHYGTKIFERFLIIKDLKPGTSYTLSVTADGLWGESDSASVVITTKSDPTRPSPPVDVHALDATTTSVTIGWKPPQNSGGSPVTGYAVSVDGTHYDMTQPTASKLTVKGLSAGTLHSFDVVAVNAIGRSDPGSVKAWTDMEPIPNPVAGPPQDLKVKGSTHSTMSLAWKPPAWNGGSPITGYRVTVKGTVWEVPSGTTLLVDGLEPGTRYRVEVQAINSAGAGEVAAVQGATILKPIPAPKPPSPPTALAASGITHTTVHLAWEKPATEGGSAITGYLISWGDARDLFVLGLAADVTGLAPGTEYTFLVRATNSYGPSEAAVAIVHTDIDPIPTPTPPGPPLHLTASGITQTSLMLDWQKPDHDGGNPISAYRVTWGTDASITVTAAGEGLDPATSAFVDGLKADTQYAFEVTAINAMGSSTPTAVVVRTQREPDPTPPSPPVEVRSGETGTSWVSLSWLPPASTGGSPVTGYVVSVDGKRFTETSGTDASVTGLSAGTLYTFDVVAVNRIGSSGPGTVEAWTGMDPVPMPTAPGPPEGLHVIGSTYTTVSLGWRPPATDGGSPVTSYLVTVDGNEWPVLEGTDIMVGGLNPGTRYAVQVVAVNQMGSSKAASTRATTLLKPTPAPTPPTAPQHLSASDITQWSAHLSWKPPQKQGGGEVLGYTLSWGAGQSAFTSATDAVIGNLQAGTEYRFDVAAVNTFGASEAATVLVLTDMDPVPTPTPPSPPQRLTATGVTQTSVLLDWEAPARDGGNPVSGYGVWVNGVFRDLMERTSMRVDALQPATAYTFEVRAVNAMGESAPATTSARTDARIDPSPTPTGQPITGSASGGNTDGSFDSDRDESTLRQTVDAKWPTDLRLISGRPKVVQGKTNLVTNAGQKVVFTITYMSPSIKSVVIQKPKSGPYRLTSTLKRGTVGGRVIVTASAPPTRYKGKQYEALQSSQQFIVKPPMHRPATAGRR